MGLGLKKGILGTGGLEVSALGLGCMGMSYHRGTALDPDTGIALIRQGGGPRRDVLRQAQVYGPFTNEQLVGEAMPVHDRWSSPRSWRARPDGQPLDSSRPELVKPTTDASLARLGIESMSSLPARV